jgi:A/G-specific adenine glycosylase
VTPRSARAALPSPAALRDLREAVLAWFADHGRQLDFRVAGRRDPWGILVSEVMAQQTQIVRVEEHWPAFMAAFPTAAAMAAAAPADVVRAWRGLGYNRRAIGLHRAAVAIVAGGGVVPHDVAELQALPGVGPYTARAVAAIAFGRPVGAVDVNVRRVAGRIVAGDPAALSASELQAVADEMVDAARPGTWTHALMDLGATVCRPARPACPECPARPWCAAAGRADSAALPSTAGMSSAAAAVSAAAARAPSAAARAPSAAADDHPAAARASSASIGLVASGRRSPVRFEETSRWLRGRIVDRLRDLPPGAMLAFDGAVGPHSPSSVAAALRALARDGVVELVAEGRARLPGSAWAPTPVRAAER